MNNDKKNNSFNYNYILNQLANFRSVYRIPVSKQKFHIVWCSFALCISQHRPKLHFFFFFFLIHFNNRSLHIFYTNTHSKKTGWTVQPTLSLRWFLYYLYWLKFKHLHTISFYLVVCLFFFCSFFCVCVCVWIY